MPVSALAMSDTEKVLADVQPRAVDDKVESTEPPPNDTKSSATEDTNLDPEEKEKEGSLRDYLVCQTRYRLRLAGLILSQRIFHYADTLDCLLYAASFTGAIAVGAALPLMTIVFGSSTGTFNDFAVGHGSSQQFTKKIDHLILYFIYLFIARFFIGYLATLAICIAATRTTRSLRKAFLESTLRQEVWHFDKQSNGSPASQVTTSEYILAE